MNLILKTPRSPSAGASGKPQCLHGGLDIFTKMKGAKA
jgi:hypothetical protein